MGFWIQFKEALLNLFSAKLRSMLAILGILVGTGSVVALITTSQLATQHALAQFKSLGTNLLAISVSEDSNGGSSSGTKGQLILKDVYKLRRKIPEIEEIAPYVSTFQTTVFAGKEFSTAVIGATKEFAEIAKFKMKTGRFVEVFDHFGQYVVIGNGLAEEFAKVGLKNPVGQQVRVGDWYFTIIGVLKPWKPNLFVYVDVDKGLIMPVSATKLISSYSKINNLLVRLNPSADLPKIQKKLSEKLKEILPTAQINIRNPQEIIDLMAKQQQTYTWLLGAIGGISLLVGGIGVMNIMLVSVIERRREIGIRLAIGAQQSNILWMFLIESVMLTLFGGILGIIIGLGVSYTIAKISGWIFYFFLMPPVLGFVVSVFVGIASGFYPALRASKLDPIESLHAD